MNELEGICKKEHHILVWTKSDQVHHQTENAAPKANSDDDDNDNDTAWRCTARWLWRSKHPAWRNCMGRTDRLLHIILKRQSGISSSSSSSPSLSSSSSSPSTLQSCATRPKYSKHLLMSNLQKAFRLCRRDTAVRTARLIIDAYPDGLLCLLRRIPMIIVEDATLHVDFAKWIWLMLAVGKGYSVPDWQLAWCFETIAALCDPNVPFDTNSWRTNDSHCWHKFRSTQRADGGGKSNVITIDAPVRNGILVSLAVRACFGGMQGDLVMLRASLDTWSRRLLGNEASHIPESFYSIGSSSNSIHNTTRTITDSPFTYPRDAIPTSADFHCSNIVGTLIRMLDLATTCADELSLLIWRQRSSTTVRVCTCLNLPIGLPGTESAPPPPPVWWTERVLPIIDTISDQIWRRQHQQQQCSSAPGEHKVTVVSHKRNRSDLQRHQLTEIRQERQQKTMQDFFSKKQI